MNTILYVFSATGNCLTTARKMAAILGDCEVVPVQALAGQRKVIVSAQRVGFVFPVYYGNMAFPMREAITRMVFEGTPYLFAFSTCRGHVGAAYQRLDQLLRTRGQKLSYATGIKMPGNSFLNEPEVDQAHLDAQDRNIADAIVPVLSGATDSYAVQDVLPLTPVDYPNNFRGIMADDACVGCGTCVKVCPMENISVKDGKAVIGDDCATCLACFHWCPTEAIYMSRQAEISRRRKYRHPDTTLDDFVVR